MFTVDEGAALLHEIYPRYPDLRGRRAIPADLERWLQEYRKQADCREASESSRTS